MVGAWHRQQPDSIVGALPGHLLTGAGSTEPVVREEAGEPSAQLGSLPASGTKAGAFPWPSASAWKATGCQHLLCTAAVMGSGCHLPF